MKDKTLFPCPGFDELPAMASKELCSVSGKIGSCDAIATSALGAGFDPDYFTVVGGHRVPSHGWARNVCDYDHRNIRTLQRKD
jgi:hypothetical protein